MFYFFFILVKCSNVFLGYAIEIHQANRLAIIIVKKYGEICLRISVYNP